MCSQTIEWNNAKFGVKQQSIIPVPSNTFSILQLSCATSEKIFKVFGRSRTSSSQNLQVVEDGQYLVEVEEALTKICKLLKAVSILVEVILMPKCISQEEQIGLFSCN